MGASDVSPNYKKYAYAYASMSNKVLTYCFLTLQTYPLREIKRKTEGRNHKLKTPFPYLMAV